MSYDSQNPWTARRGGVATQGEYDLGLRQYMLRVYNYMASGLAVTGIVAWLAADTGIYLQLAHTPFIWVVMLAPLALVFAFSAGIQRMSFGTAQLLYWVYSALMGLSLGYIFLRYTQASIATTFFITAAMFLGMSVYGYTTKADLTKMGSFMMMGLFGIIIASVVNIFLGSSALYFAISIIGVVVFTGLTAWDTQRIAQQYYMPAVGSGDMVGKGALMGALQLYLDFLNLFLLMLRLFGNTRD
ncbi:MAG: Bax inhibitor-1/YccA family protein [Aliidongia sp.]